VADYTLAALRIRIARLLGDNVSGTATGGSTTTLVDTAELVNYAGTTAGMGDALFGSYVYINGGTGSGQERRISSNTQSSGTITVPTWLAPSTDSTYEIHSQWRVADYNAAINTAINDCIGDGGALVTQVADVSITMTDDNTSASYYLTLPVALRTIKYVIPEGPISGIYDELPLTFGVDYYLEKKTAATSPHRRGRIPGGSDDGHGHHRGEPGAVHPAPGGVLPALWPDGPWLARLAGQPAIRPATTRTCRGGTQPT